MHVAEVTFENWFPEKNVIVLGVGKKLVFIGILSSMCAFFKKIIPDVSLESFG